MQSSPQRRQLFSLNNVCNWTSEPCSFLQANPITGKNPDPLLGFLVLNESRLKWLATERAPSTHFPLSHLILIPHPPTSILTQYQERQSLPRVIYKRWSNLQTSSKLHRVMSSHFSVHFCTFHAGPVPQRVWTPKGNVALSLVMLRVIDWGGGRRKKVACIFLSLSGPFRALS